jgi:hypothetical protein
MKRSEIRIINPPASVKKAFTAAAKKQKRSESNLGAIIIEEWLKNNKENKL